MSGEDPSTRPIYEASVYEASFARLTAKWAGLGACTLIASVWAFSYSPYIIWIMGSDRSSFVERGEIKQTLRAYHPKWWDGRSIWHVRRRGWFMPAQDDISLPFWLMFFVAGVPMVLAWWPDLIVAYSAWRDRRGPVPGSCQRCGYDLTGNVSGRCPECGTPT